MGVSEPARGGTGALPPPTLWGVVALAAPIMLSNATTPLIGFVDSVVIGRLGDAALIGGVALGAAIFNAIYWCFGFLRMSTTGFTAQAVGAGNGPEVGASLARAMLIALGVGLIIVVFQAPIRSAFLWFLGGSEAVQAATRAYYDWRIFAAPAGLVNFALLGWFIGLGRTGVAFWLQLALNVANIVLAVGLVLGLGRGVAGVGLAAFLAETLAAVGGVMMARREVGRRGGATTWSTVLDAGKLRAMFAANRDIMIRTACVLASGQIFMRFGAGQGDDVLAANAVLLGMLYITYYLLDGYAHAAEALVGQAVGAHNRRHLDATVRLSMVAGGLTGIVVGLAVWTLGPGVIAFMTTNATVRQVAAEFLPWVALLPFVGVWCFLLDGVFIGATRTVDMRNMMLVSFAIYLVAIAVLMPPFGNHGLWAAHMVFFVARAVTLAWRYPALADAVARRHSA